MKYLITIPLILLASVVFLSHAALSDMPTGEKATFYVG